MSCCTNKILSAIKVLFCLNSSHSLWCNEKSVLTLSNFSRFFNSFSLILLKFNPAVIDDLNHSLSFSFFGFIVAFLLTIQSGEIIYDSRLVVSSSKPLSVSFNVSIAC